MIIKEIEKDLAKYADAKQSENLARFFKTGKGEYGEGDVFLGIKVPNIRLVVRKYFLDLDLSDIEKLLYSKYHEYRMFAVLTLVYQYKAKKFEDKRKDIYNFYIKNIKQVNNWDLVDVTCSHIVGAYLLDQDRKILYDLAKSKNLWKKRVSIISTFAFIKAGQFDDSLKLADILMKDSHDLIHKAVGWTIRNVGIKDVKLMESYLKTRYKDMPRTMLRYAIEKLPEKRRKEYLQGAV